MSRKYDAIKRLRSQVLNAWWRLRGVPIDDQPMTNEQLYAEADDLRIEPIEEELTFAYPRWRMFGEIEDVQKRVAAQRSCPSFDPAGQSWRGDVVVKYPFGFLTKVPNGSVLSRSGLILTSKQQVISLLSGGTLESILPGVTSSIHVPRPKRVRGKVLVMSRGLVQRNYYHWMIEMLSLMRLLKESRTTIDYIAVPHRKAFTRQSLELLGFKPSMILPMARFTHIQADELIVPGDTGHYPHPAGVSYLREAMRETAWSHYASERRERIYITRKSCGSRRLVGESQLLAALQPLGFRRVCLEDLSVREQIQLFQRAEAIVGPHGAGFTNTIFCRPGTVVLEISPTCRPRPYFHCISHVNQLNFGVYFGKPVHQQGVDSDIEIDVPTLCAGLTAMLNQRHCRLAQTA